AVVRAQATGKQAVAEGHLDFIGRAQATGAERAGHQFRPDLNIVVGVAHHGGAAGGARRSVNTRNLVLSYRKHSEGVFGAQSGLVSKWELRHIGKFLEVIWVHANLVELTAVVRHVVVRVAQLVFRALGLQRDDFIA